MNTIEPVILWHCMASFLETQTSRSHETRFHIIVKQECVKYQGLKDFISSRDEIEEFTFNITPYKSLHKALARKQTGSLAFKGIKALTVSNTAGMHKII